MRRPDIDRIAAALAVVRVGLQAVALQPYGFFRDEPYCLACARRPGLGYVDHPPLSVWFLRGWTAVFGESLVAVRLVPALVEAAVVFFTVRLARALGAGDARSSRCSRSRRWRTRSGCPCSRKSASSRT